MKLLNFELSSPSYGIELIGLGFAWDLHNAGIFSGIVVDADDNSVCMRWALSGHPITKFSGCPLLFIGLKVMIISPRNEDLPRSEGLCISGISKLIPEPGERLEYRVKRQWHENDRFHLLFQFQSGRSIEVDADSVELIGTSTADAR
jgi:hypothetical protein